MLNDPLVSRNGPTIENLGDSVAYISAIAESESAKNQTASPHQHLQN